MKQRDVSIYVCGITPYDTTHLGHAFTFLTYDFLVRYLKFTGCNVTYAQNVTDIDDDILIRAAKVGLNWKDLGTKETKKHLKNMDSLNALRPDFFPKATENITEMQKIIKVLVNKGYAYGKNGSVYFEVNKYKKFGQLSKLGYQAQLEIANERGNYPQDPNKKDPLDFVLWQNSQPNEPSWHSPWGDGRPGWHIECSAMSMKYLGKTITIHGGGEDLLFPHHEAEMAQSENYTNQQFVKIWMHTAMVYCDHKKMSKSLGNMIFVHDLLKKYSPNAIRLYLAMHHYRKPWNYEQKELEKAAKSANDLSGICKRENPLDYNNLKKVAPKFTDALENDFDLPSAIQYLLKISKTPSKETNAVIATACSILGFL